MAARAKPATGKGPKKKDGLNGIDPAELRKYFNQVHEVTDSMEEENATSRGKIGRIYEKAADTLGVTKSALMLVFKAERRQMKDDAKAAKMDGEERDSLQKIGQAIGGTLGDWAASYASKIPEKQPEESGDE